MTTTTRILPREEWHRLRGTDLEAVLAHFTPAHDVAVVVVERDGAIVGRWVLLPVLHVEGLWIDPALRGHASVARRLWRGMREVVAERQATSVLTGAVSDDVRALLAHAGAHALPEQFVLPMEI